jgi:hypothetical protein
LFQLHGLELKLDAQFLMHNFVIEQQAQLLLQNFVKCLKMEHQKLVQLERGSKFFIRRPGSSKINNSRYLTVLAVELVGLFRKHNY